MERQYIKKNFKSTSGKIIDLEQSLYGMNMKATERDKFIKKGTWLTFSVSQIMLNVQHITNRE